MEDIKIILIKNSTNYSISISNNIENENYDLLEFLKYGNTFKEVNNINLLANSEFKLIDIIKIEQSLNLNKIIKEKSWILEKERLNILSFINSNKEYFKDIDNSETDLFLLYLDITEKKTYNKLKKILLSAIDNNIEENNPFIQVDNINNDKYINYFNKVIILTNSLSITDDFMESWEKEEKEVFFSVASFYKTPKSNVDIDKNTINLINPNVKLFFKETMK
jgi:hypothetical protein